MAVTIQAFATRSPPTFATPAEARAHALRRLAGACRLLGLRGCSEGLLGHVTVRDPEHADRYWVNPAGLAMRQVRPADLLQVSHRGEVLQGRGAVNPVGLLLHTAVHRARPDVTAVCHAHALHASTWASLGRVLEPINQDAAVFHGQQALIEAPGIVDDEAKAERFAAAFGKQRVAIHVNHGVFTTGQSVDEATWWFLHMNRCCEAALLAEAVGKPRRYDEADARWLASTLGSPQFGWLSYQTLWDEYLAADPELAG